jgi:hypothetical protein
VFFGGGVEQTKIKAGTNIPAAYLAYSDTNGSSSNAIPLTIGWSRDDRDSALAPPRHSSLHFDHLFEAAKDHAFAVEGHGRVAGGGGVHARVFDHLLHGGVARGL